MKNLRKIVLAVFVLLFISLTGCAKWYELIEIRKEKEGYDEFAGMSHKQIRAFNANASNKDKIVCKNKRPTGSNIPKRTCNWKSAIDRRSAEDQKIIDDKVRHITVPRK